MRFITLFLAGLFVISASPFLFGIPHELSSPGFPASSVDENGWLIEDWGTLRFSVSDASAAQKGTSHTQTYRNEGPFPKVTRRLTAGSLVLEQEAFRAPVWPGGVDVIVARLTNPKDKAQTATLTVEGSESVVFGDRYGMAGGRRVFSAPENLKPVRIEQHPWGCTGGVEKLPGWARPSVACDGAFKNISAGMGGVPIRYRFKTKDRKSCTAVLGFCESHWSTAGRRPLLVQVEGAQEVSVDPVKKWGQHGPGCLAFNAFDQNTDGWIDIAVIPHPEASDKNTILNVIWLFPSSTSADADAIMQGKLNDKALYYVDVGGQKDQLIYKTHVIEYRVPLAAKETKSCLFFVASPGCRHVPDQAATAWTEATLKKAAADVWMGNR